MLFRLALSLVLAAAFVGCGDDDGAGGDGGTDTDTDTDMDSDTDSDSDSDTDTDTDTDADSDGDYWEDGACPGGDEIGWIQASNDCQDVLSEGCCDENDNVIWCEDGVLYCRPCATYDPPYTCSWDVNDDGSYYWCTETDQGEDPAGIFPEECGATDTDTDTDTDADGGAPDAGADAGD